MKHTHIRKFVGLMLSVAAALTMAVPAFASDYSFTTTASQDYYGSTSYEQVYGSWYNYGGTNAADCQTPELEYGVLSATMIGVMERTVLPALQMTAATVSDDSGTILLSTAATTTPSYMTPAFTALTDSFLLPNGAIGCISIPAIGVSSYYVWEGETTASMAKGLGHFTGASVLDGNVTLCGHNRGARYVIGAIKDLTEGDLIIYTTAYGARAYQVATVQIISSTDWSYLQPTADNRVTLVTCLADHPESRVLVQAVEKM